jgi:predicted  nucleic acid-binding Zn-ribbon protein
MDAKDAEIGRLKDRLVSKEDDLDNVLRANKHLAGEIEQWRRRGLAAEAEAERLRKESTRITVQQRTVISRLEDEIFDLCGRLNLMANEMEKVMAKRDALLTHPSTPPTTV